MGPAAALPLQQALHVHRGPPILLIILLVLLIRVVLTGPIPREVLKQILTIVVLSRRALMIWLMHPFLISLCKLFV